MLRVCFVLATLTQYVAVELDGCAAAPDTAHQCHEDVTNLLQHHRVKMIERAPTKEKPSQLKTEQDDFCLDYHYNNGNAYMHLCHKGDNQQWYFDGERLRETRDDKCLDWELGSTNVKLYPCHDQDNQKWYFDGKELKSKSAHESHDSSKCLTYGIKEEENDNVHMHPCNREPGQQWSFDPVDCKLSDWTDWSTCSKTCGGGKRSRSRTVTTEPENGGKDCGETEEEEDCKDKECPVHCVFSDWTGWSACSATCGAAAKTRSRTVGTPAQHGGQACDPEQAKEMEDCSVLDCPALLKTKQNDNCLDLDLRDEHNDNVYMHGCHAGNNQKWYFDGEHIKTLNDKRCLDYDVRDENGDNVYVHACHEGNNQKWYFDGELLKTREGDRCLDYDVRAEKHHNVYVHDCHSADNQKWYFSS